MLYRPPDAPLDQDDNPVPPASSLNLAFNLALASALAFCILVMVLVS